jgi:hypothetical protein
VGKTSRKIRRKSERAIGYLKGLDAGLKNTVSQAVAQISPYFFSSLAIVLKKRMELSDDKIVEMMTDVYKLMTETPNLPELVEEAEKETGVVFNFGDPFELIKEGE